MRSAPSATWHGDRCIICCEQRPLTKEHVIPESIGGRLWVRFVCKGCNETLGQKVDAGLRRDPAIRLAAAKLPGIEEFVRERVLSGQKYLGRSLAGKVRLTLMRGQIRPDAAKLEDGSLIIPDIEADRTLRRLLQQRGKAEHEIEQAIARYRNSPEDRPVFMGAGLVAINRPVGTVTPIMSDEEADDVAFLKIAYEWLALQVGVAIYRPELECYRQVLRGEARHAGIYKVERLQADGNDQIHGLVAENNQPHAIVQVRLFGSLAYRIHFHTVAIDGPRSAYFLDLRDRSEGLENAVI